jgi:NhaP-type Na+/H+ and K+/H+ antiporter
MTNFTLLAKDLYTNDPLVAVVLIGDLIPWEGNPRAVPRTTYKVEFKSVKSITNEDVIFTHNNNQEVELLVSKLFVPQFTSSSGKYFGEYLNIGFYRCNAKAVDVESVYKMIDSNKQTMLDVA